MNIKIKTNILYTECYINEKPCESHVLYPECYADEVDENGEKVENAQEE